MNDTLCHCKSGITYAGCCQPYLDGQRQPQSPEQLMRSRYSAFCTGNIDYLIATHHPLERRSEDRQTLANTFATTQWLALRVLNSSTNGKMGRVEFIAFYQGKGSVEQLHERSTFICQDDRWYYQRGDLLEPIALGRNDPCWCGSGKKIKMCHGIMN